MSEEAGALGSLHRLDPRQQWGNEATDFTPWIANQENISELASALGMELEVESTEVAVGAYSADVLAREPGTGGYVVIENQLGKTNHDHLGKALTYGAVLDASTVVWIAPEFTDEHRKTLDWLNDNTGDDLCFYGVQVELWQIDDSRPAVRFNAVSRPANVVKTALIYRSEGQRSEIRELQLAWWTQFADLLRERGVVASPRAPRPQSWYDIPLGRTGVHLSDFANTFDKRIGVRVYMRARRGGASALAQLLEERSAIESELGDALEWDPNPDAQDKTIALRKDCDLFDRTAWPENLEWLVGKTERFISVFRPRVQRLQLQAPEMDVDD